MKATYKHIAFAALALSAVACSQDNDFAPSYLSAPDAVSITAQVGTNDATGGFTRSNPLGTVEEQAKFNPGDQIAVTAGTQSAVTYQLGTDGTWAPTGTDYLKWQAATMDVTACYPAGKNDASATTFTVPTGYADLAALADADYMIYSGTQTKGTDNSISLTMQRKMVRIVIDQIMYNNQFYNEDGKLVYSVTAITVHGNTTGYADGTPEEGDVAVTAYKHTDGAFYALLAPTNEALNETFLTVTVAHNTDATDVHTLYVKAIPATTAGNSYSFALTVGKDAVSIGSVSVTGWTETTIPGGEMEEVYIVDATGLTADELKTAVANALAAGGTDIRIKLAEDADATMFSAITAALAADGVADGSINLTISGAKTVLEYGFFDQENYFANGEKNIAGDKLKSLTLTDVETIGEYAFSACTYLESVYLPQVVTVGNYAFNEWKKGTKLTSLDLPNATTIGEWAFAYSSLLTSVNLPKVVSIEVFAFGGCDLRTLDLPEVTTIGGGAFENNYNLVSCSAPKTTTFGYYPWGNCSKLEILELTAAGDFTLSNNFFGYTPTEQINLVLNKDKESQVTQNDDGTAIWKTNTLGGEREATFKSITTQE